MNKLRNGLVNSLKISGVARIFLEVRKTFPHLPASPSPRQQRFHALYVQLATSLCIDVPAPSEKNTQAHTGYLAAICVLFPAFFSKLYRPTNEPRVGSLESDHLRCFRKNISKKQPESNELRTIALFKFISYLR